MSEKKILENSLHDKTSVGIHAAAAIFMGYVSLTLAAMFGNWITVFSGFGLLILMGFALQKGLGNKGIKWWIGNGAFIYLFIWLISWTFFFNMAM
jgi:hypothetical protein